MPHDVAVIGGGPAGLSAALNAGAEGLETCLIAEVLGGQAGTSSRIENYAGFHDGISGPALTSRMERQCRKFGVHVVKCCVTSIEKHGECYHLTLSSGTVIRSRSIIIATGATYQQLPGLTGNGVHYACTHATVRRDCQCDEVAVVGGGNSAGQAAMFLSTKARLVHLIVRRDNLRDTMSHYLLSRILATPNIFVHYESEIIGSTATDDRVCTITTNKGTTLDVSDVYVMIGSKPNTAFLKGIVALDEKGFVVTPTGQPGVFAVGDCRAGSVKRVANAAGEGAAIVPTVWSYLNGL
jgi:thioredoxin reductase (NADPH)